jgi:hypothetical protein
MLTNPRIDDVAPDDDGSPDEEGAGRWSPAVELQLPAGRDEAPPTKAAPRAAARERPDASLRAPPKQPQRPQTAAEERRAARVAEIAAELARPAAVTVDVQYDAYDCPHFVLRNQTSVPLLVSIEWKGSVEGRPVSSSRDAILVGKYATWDAGAEWGPAREFLKGDGPQCVPGARISADGPAPALTWVDARPAGCRADDDCPGSR